LHDNGDWVCDHSLPRNNANSTANTSANTSADSASTASTSHTPSANR